MRMYLPALAALSLLALGACTVNTSPPVVATPAAPNPVVVQTPPPAPSPGTVVVQPHY